MDIKTEFIRTESGHIQLSEPAHGMTASDRFFYFQTRTVITLADGGKVAVRSTRAMALGLLTYFLANRPFQDEVLRQNESHAVAHFNNR